MCWFIFILVKFGFIHKKFHYLSKLKIALWMTISFIFGGYLIYADMKTIIWGATNDISYMYSVLSTDILLPLQTCLSFPLLGYLTFADNEFMIDSELKPPRRLIHLFFFIVSSVVAHSFMANILSQIANTIFICFMMALCSITEIISVVLIGTSLTHLQLNIIKMNEVEINPHKGEECRKLIHRFKNQKRGLGPNLFLIFSTRMIVLLSFTYFSLHHISSIPLLSFVVSIGLQMSYITFTLDDCYNTFKGIKKTLR